MGAVGREGWALWEGGAVGGGGDGGECKFCVMNVHLRGNRSHIRSNDEEDHNNAKSSSV